MWYLKAFPCRNNSELASVGEASYAEPRVAEDVSIYERSQLSRAIAASSFPQAISVFASARRKESGTSWHGCYALGWEHIISSGDSATSACRPVADILMVYRFHIPSISCCCCCSAPMLALVANLETCKTRWPLIRLLQAGGGHWVVQQCLEWRFQGFDHVWLKAFLHGL